MELLDSRWACRLSRCARSESSSCSAASMGRMSSGCMARSGARCWAWGGAVAAMRWEREATRWGPAGQMHVWCAGK